MTNQSNHKEGKIITFYSYKGGTGRTMALANIACLLAMNEPDKKMLVTDWDLEAPGLHRYFLNYLESEDTKKEFDDQKGILELFKIYENELKALNKKEENDKQDAADDLETVLKKINLDEFILKLSVSSNPSINTPNEHTIYFLKAGVYDTTYTKRLSQFNWNEFFYLAPTFFQAFAEYLSNQYDYILVDSRTGNTDIGGICTHILPEKLVTVFTPNRQSLTGILELAKKAISYRKDADDFRPLEIIPLPSRIDLENSVQRVNWKNGNETENIIGYQKQFEELFREIYTIKSSKISLDHYFNWVQIRHDSTYAYGEKIAVLEENHQDTAAFANNYWLFYQELFKEENIYELPNLKNVLIYYEKEVGKITSSIIDELYNIENEEVVIFYANTQTTEEELNKLAAQADFIIIANPEEGEENQPIMKENNTPYYSRNDQIIERFRETKKNFKIPMRMSQGKLIDFRIEGDYEEFAHYKKVIEEKLTSLRDDEIRTQQKEILDSIVKKSKNEDDLIRIFLNHIRNGKSDKVIIDYFFYETELYKNLSKIGKQKFEKGRKLITNSYDFYISYNYDNVEIINKEFSAILEYFDFEQNGFRKNLLAELIIKLLIDEGLIGFTEETNKGQQLLNVSKKIIQSSFAFIPIINTYSLGSELFYKEYNLFKKSTNMWEGQNIFPLLTDSLFEIIPAQIDAQKQKYINEIKNIQSLDLSQYSNAYIFQTKYNKFAISNIAKDFQKEIKKIARKIVHQKEKIIDQYIQSI